MNITITGNIPENSKTNRYVEKTIGSLESYLSKPDRESATAEVSLLRVDREHGNKYEARVRIQAGAMVVEASDSTLNVLAALDIVRAKLLLELKNHKNR